jgi:uncharacterized protein
MVMATADASVIGISILAKAPIAGLAKTRLIPALGPHRAARVQARLLERTVVTACAAHAGPVTVWATPGAGHPVFGDLKARLAVRIACQPDGDLGARMLAALEPGPALVVGTDCAVLRPDHLRRAADCLRHGADCVIIPAEDGGYVLIGLRQPTPVAFRDMVWSVPTVLTETRRRLAGAGLRIHELAPLWDIDQPADLERARQAGLADLLE